jgi:hypothetical protein
MKNTRFEKLKQSESQSITGGNALLVQSGPNSFANPDNLLAMQNTIESTTRNIVPATGSKPITF